MGFDNFDLYGKYKIIDLIEALNNKAFYYGKGMVYDQSKNVLVLTSSYEKGRLYQDRVKNNMIFYTGEGQTGDQNFVAANKRLLNAKRDNTTVYLFAKYNAGEYTFYGEVELADSPYLEDELDANGNMRKVIKFPLKLLQANIQLPMTSEEMRHHYVTGGVPIREVVGAAIFKNNQVLVARRGDEKLKGLYEFPGGTVEKGETKEEALKRELIEEMDCNIRIIDELDISEHYDGKEMIRLTVFKCEALNTPKCIEHEEIAYKNIDELENLNWCPSDIKIMQTIVDSQPARIINEISLNYHKAVKKEPRDSEIKRANQDYEKSAKKKAKNGLEAELAVIEWEMKRLLDLGRSDLAMQIEQVSKISPDYGYDIKSFDIIDGKVEEIHIEVKSARLSESKDKLEFFVSTSELRKYKNDENYRIYCLIKSGDNYSLHKIKREQFLKEDYCYPISFKVSIPVSELFD